LAGLAPILWALTRPHEAVATSQRAVGLLADDGDIARHAWTLCYHGLLLTGVDRYAEALPVAAAAVGTAERLGSASLLGLAQGLHGRVRYHLGEEAGHDEMLQGIATAAAVPHHQHVLMTSISLVQELWMRGRYAEVEKRVEDGIAYGHEHDLDFYLDYLLGHRLRLLVVRGDWPAAEAGLRACGRHVIPRGPKPTTRENPAGLTDRQVEILRLLADGRTNAEIAARLVLSVRTVDHHVSAVLQKLGVTSRREVAAAAAGLGLGS